MDENIKDSQWVKLQDSLAQKLNRMYRETHQQEQEQKPNGSKK
jgi:hypothetical protein